MMIVTLSYLRAFVPSYIIILYINPSRYNIFIKICYYCTHEGIYQVPVRSVLTNEIFIFLDFHKLMIIVGRERPTIFDNLQFCISPDSFLVSFPTSLHIYSSVFGRTRSSLSSKSSLSSSESLYRSLFLFFPRSLPP